MAHPAKEQAGRAATELTEVFTSKGIEVVEAAFGSGAELLIALGGDGTILRAARIAVEDDIPLVGLNLGHLGFLSSADVSDLTTVAERLIEGDHTIDSRMMLEAELSGHEERVLALNEVVVERGGVARLISVSVKVGEDDIATYAADGFIVATPTGSTAYSLSAGGPVVEPRVDAMILTSVSAHAPLWRSIVVGPDRTVTLTMNHEVAVSADGQECGTVTVGGTLKVSPHARRLQLIELGNSPFFQKLRSRFMLDPSA